MSSSGGSTKIFKVSDDGRCGYCLWDAPLYALAESQEDAEALYASGDAGLCAECLVPLLMDAHGPIGLNFAQDPTSVRIRLNSQN